jgi:hypothetical protein
VDGEIWLGVVALVLFALGGLALAMDLGGISRRVVEKNRRTVEAGKITAGAYARTEREARTRGWIVFGICAAGAIAVVIIGVSR